MFVLKYFSLTFEIMSSNKKKDFFLFFQQNKVDRLPVTRRLFLNGPKELR